ncbi:peptidylprolyl isomerase [Mycobacterium sp. SMC-4]|uniref:peptidylprolyl isomerase n=1 Tax=Mycobacterium sp. SMC-4 TaxID=2857059 RepID=UPI003CFCF0B5
MPTNEQRRAAAKRKLERQMERRAENERKRRLYTIIGSAVAALVVIGAVAATIVLTNRDSGDETASTPDTSGRLPSFVAADDLGSDCQYPEAEEASKPNTPPRTGQVPTEPAEVSASMATNRGNIGLLLDNAKSPCTVNSFASLAQQGYFNDTPCHRLTTSESLGVLQCGDPTGQGTGGPGYQFANEYPTDQYQPDDPRLNEPVLYPRGTLAMANAGPGTNGSQFFLVYQDSQLPPQYTVFGTIDETGLATLDKIAAEGVEGGGPDGAPKLATTVKSIALD